MASVAAVSLGVGVDTASPFTRVTSAAIPPGALAVCAVGWVKTGATALTPSVSGGSLTWTQDKLVSAGVSSNGFEVQLALFSAPAPAGLASGTTLTVSVTGGTADFGLQIGAFYLTGVDLRSSRVDASSGQVRDIGSATTTISPTGATTTYPHTALVGVGWSDDTATASTPAGSSVEIFDSHDATLDWTLMATLAEALVTDTYGGGGIGTWTGGTPQVDAALLVAYKAAEINIDTATESVRTATTDPWTFSHAGRAEASGGVQGVALLAIHGASSTDHITGAVTYDGVALSRVVTATDTAVEPGRADIWFVGSGLAGHGGTKTVSVDLASATGDDFEFVCITFYTDDGSDIDVVDFDSISEDATNPSVTLQYGSRYAIAVAGLYGGGAAPSSLTPNANCIQVASEDLGNFYAYVLRQAIPDTSDFAIGGTAATEDVAYVAAAFAKVTAAAYTLDCQPGSFGVTGAAATLAAARLFDAQPGSYSVTGVLASIVAGRAVNAAAGSYAVTGAAATVLADHAVLGDPGAYTVTGTAATTAAGLSLDAQPGAYALTGEAATVVPGYAALADPGSFAVTGVDADLVYTPVGAFALDAQPGSFTVAGSDAAPVYGAALNAQPGSYAATGADADLVVVVPGAYVLNVEPGVYVVTGTNATTVAAREVDAGPAAYTISGLAATVVPDRNIAANAGSYTVTGNAATIVADRLLAANAGTVAFTGFSASLGSIFDYELDAATGNVTVTGATANLVFAPGLARLTTRGGRIRWNTTGSFRGENHAGRITKTKEGAVA